MADNPAPSPTPPTVAIHYIKSNEYRDIACEGALGGLTPQANKIWMALYSERFAIPQVIGFVPEAVAGMENTYRLNENVPPSFVNQKEGLVRTVQACAYLDLPTAQRLHTWLGERIKQLEESINAGHPST